MRQPNRPRTEGTGFRLMRVERMAALTDGLIAIILTIMVLDLPLPAAANFPALARLWPVFAAYALAYVNVGLFWNNHHHLLATVEHVDGRVLWANLALLFFLSLMPFVIRWIGVAGLVALPLAGYGAVLTGAALCYWLLQGLLIRRNGGRDGALARAVGQDWKGKASMLAYLLATGLSFAFPLGAVAIYLGVAVLWLVPDRRLERSG